MSEIKCKRIGIAILLVLGLSAVAISFVIHIYGLDFRIARALHDSSLGETGWLTGKASPWIQFYRYGEYPAVIMAIIAFAIFLLTKAGKLPASCSKPCLVIVLTVILGPGLAVNGLLKNCWGRPRPADTSHFRWDLSGEKFHKPRRTRRRKIFRMRSLRQRVRSVVRSRFLPILSGHRRIVSRGWVSFRRVRELRKNGPRRPLSV